MAVAQPFSCLRCLRVQAQGPCWPVVTAPVCAVYVLVLCWAVQVEAVPLAGMFGLCVAFLGISFVCQVGLGGAAPIAAC